MNSARLLKVLLFLLIATCVQAQHHILETKQPSGAVDLGDINFPTSGPVDAQKHFIQGVLLLHSFEYGRAQQSFAEAAKIAPSFAMAYWGEAMTYNHSIWGEQDKAAALGVLARLGPTPTDRAARAPTEREKLYFAAIERLYGDGNKAQRDAAYSDAMAELARRFPDDLEAQAFYSLSLLGLTNTVRNNENYMRAAAVAESIFAKNSKHPGTLHYLIHAYDDPAHAKLGLRAARLYGTVARGASHAQHMPSHIFFALGMWEDSIAANTAAMKTARDQGAGGYYALHWLEHGLLQIGRDEEAAKLVAIIEDDIKRSPSAYARSHLAMTRATWLVETRGAGPPSMMQPVDSSGIRSFSVFAGHDMAIGLEYVHRKDLTAARQALLTLQKRNEEGRAAMARGTDVADRYSAVSQSEVAASVVMEQILGAAIQFASGDRENAIRKILAASETEDNLVFEYGPPAIVKPAWEVAGEMLLMAGRKREAAKAFQNVLKRYPNRRLSNEGLRKSAN
jgi:tetratricopeptide (TPR) repeat protein